MLLSLAIYTWEMPVQLHHIKSNRFKLVNRNRLAKRKNVPNPSDRALWDHNCDSSWSQHEFIKFHGQLVSPWTKKSQRAGDAKLSYQDSCFWDYDCLDYLSGGPTNRHAIRTITTEILVMLVRAWVVKLQRVYLICVCLHQKAVMAGGKKGNILLTTCTTGALSLCCMSHLG